LNDSGHDAIHTLDLPAQNATSDADVIAVADRGNRIVVTKDDDFRVSLMLTGRPHRLIRIATGNISNDELLRPVNSHLDAIQEAFGGALYLVLSSDRMTAHAEPNEPSN